MGIKLAIIPAAGRATRLGGAVKELLPVPVGNTPMTALANMLEVAQIAGCTEAALVVSTAKAAVLMDAVSSSSSLPVSFIHQANPRGIGDAVMRARHLIERSEATVLLMPDTVLLPREGPRDAMNALLASKDMLAVATLHHVDAPERFGAAVFEDEKVVAYRDKQNPAPSSWVWTSVAFRPEFLRYIAIQQESTKEIGVSEALDAATRHGLATAIKQPGGMYADIGTLVGWQQILK